METKRGTKKRRGRRGRGKGCEWQATGCSCLSSLERSVHSSRRAARQREREGERSGEREGKEGLGWQVKPARILYSNFVFLFR